MGLTALSGVFLLLVRRRTQQAA